MSAKLQLEKEIREAVVFLREKNQTIPSDTIEFMKVASLEKLNSLEEPHIIVLGNPETIEAFMTEFAKTVFGSMLIIPEKTGLKNAKGDEIKIGDEICTDGLFIGKQPESFWGEIRADYKDQGIISIDAWQTPDDNEEGQVIAKVNMKTGEVQYLDARAKTDSYAQEIIIEVLNTQLHADMEINTEIIAILMRKKLGQDCTEAESAEIKGYLKELKLPEEQPLVAEIQQWFPQEYGEYLDETGKE